MTMADSVFDEGDLEKITKMLERGGTMLAKHCGECGSPLFKYQGRIVCPVCDSKAPKSGLAVPVETRPAVTAQPSMETVREENRMVEVTRGQTPVVIGGDRLEDSTLETVIVAKINDVTARLANEEYPDKIQMYLNILETSLKVLKEIRGLRK
jgi:UPF0148 protein